MLYVSVAMVVVLSGWTALGAEKVLDFREDKQNEKPRGFQAAAASGRTPGEWKVIQDEVPSLLEPVSPRAQPLGRRQVLAQVLRDPTDEHFPLLIYEEDTFGDFTLTTRLKMVDGKEEQMAGIAFRLQDERNYYYIRASALGKTVHFFKVVNGLRGPPIGNSIAVPKGVWHELTIECKGTRIRALLNGKEIIPPLDDKTFTSGKIAFLTKSDSVSYFADTVIQYKPKQTLAEILVKDAFTKYPRLLGLMIFAPKAGASAMQVVASLDPSEIGQPAPSEAKDVLEKQGYYYGRGGGTVVLTLPLRDHNGEKVAAVRVVMKGFLGQTEKNAVARAMPVVQGMETRIQTLQDLVQ